MHSRLLPASSRSPFLRRSTGRACTALLLVALATGSTPHLGAARLVVDAGAHARTHAPVSFPWPGPETTLELHDPGGVRIPVQVSAGRAWFLEPGLVAGTTRRYEIRTDTVPAAPHAGQAIRHDDAVELKVQGRTALTYLAGPGQLPRPDIRPGFRRGGYLHPVLTPSGHAVTDDYPPNHLHQHALWWSWSKTSFEGRAPDFWNMGQGTGRTDFEALDATESGPVFAGFRARQVYTDLLVKPPRLALRETWNVRIFALARPSPHHLFDLESEQRAAGDAPLKLPKYHYGGFAFRGLWSWNGPTNVLYLDSNRVTNRVAANETRPRWFWMGGPAEGTPPGTPPPIVGLALLGHPANFRAPQPLRVHPTEPYTAWSPSQLGDWAIAPGETYLSRYRVVVLDGPPDPAELDRLWNDFAEPPAARVE